MGFALASVGLQVLRGNRSSLMGLEGMSTKSAFGRAFGRLKFPSAGTVDPTTLPLFGRKQLEITTTYWWTSPVYAWAFHAYHLQGTLGCSPNPLHRDPHCSCVSHELVAVERLQDQGGMIACGVRGEL